MHDIEVVQAILRACVYLGTIAAAGSVFFRLSFSALADDVAIQLKRQAVFGASLLLVIEPLRYYSFQLAIAGGDLAVAFGPDLRWMSLETPTGQAAAVRLIAAVLLLICYGKSRPVAVGAAVALVGSYLLEGHTASESPRLLFSGLLLLHLLIAHWWLGALYPLACLARQSDQHKFRAGIEAFSKAAIWLVPVLIGAGTVLVLLLTKWTFDPANAYQQRFLIKLICVAAILAIAVRNKFWITPELNDTPAVGVITMRKSIMMEIAVALAILVATGWLLRTGPDHQHDHGDHAVHLERPAINLYRHHAGSRSLSRA